MNNLQRRIIVPLKQKHNQSQAFYAFNRRHNSDKHFSFSIRILNHHPTMISEITKSYIQ